MVLCVVRYMNQKVSSEDSYKTMDEYCDWVEEIRLASNDYGEQMHWAVNNILDH